MFFVNIVNVVPVVVPCQPVEAEVVVAFVVASSVVEYFLPLSASVVVAVVVPWTYFVVTSLVVAASWDSLVAVETSKVVALYFLVAAVV